jgi:SAM-dependent methyltransferase
MINKLVVDSSFSRTPLCDLGVKYPTDKSPYNTGSASGHRHAYTAVYDMLLSPRRHLSLTVGEIGIEHNHSMMCWREYFPHARLVGWEYYAEKLEKARNDNLENTEYFYIDVTQDASVAKALLAPSCMFDIIVEDSTHRFEDQVRVLQRVHSVLNPGGYFIVEDIFKSRAESDYEQALAPYLKYYHSATFVEAEHITRDSGAWNNDKLLVLVRNAERG